MTAEERALLVESVASAWRPPSRDEVAFHPTWYDLDAEGRAAAFEEARQLRLMEAALDPDNLSCSARAVLSRIR